MTQEAKAKQDALSAKLGSETTSEAAKAKEKAKGKVYTPEEIRKLESDATAKKGRELVQANAEIARLKEEGVATNARLDDIERAQTARAYDEARSDPSGNTLRNIQAGEAARTRERDVQARESEANRREAQLKADREQFATESGETMVSVVAAKHGVSEERLAKLGFTDKATLEAVAADMKANAPETEVKPLTAEQEAAKAEAEEKGETYSPTDETPSGAKPVDLTPEGVESASLESLEQALTPPIK